MTTALGETRSDGQAVGPTTDEAEFVLNGARRCVRKATSTGVRCKNPAVRGGVLCRKHGGTAKQIRRAAERRIQEQALADEIARLDLTLAPGVHPEEAILAQVGLCAQVVAHYTGLIARLEPSDTTPGLKVVKVNDATGTERAVSEHVIVKALGEWSDRLTRTAKVAIDADVSQRQVVIREAEAVMLATVIKLILADLGHDPEDREVGKVVATRLLAVSASPPAE